MPNKDGKGPLNNGSFTRGRTGRQGQTRNMSFGPGGYCLCPACGEKTAHNQGIPCTSMKCPKCGAIMIRGN